MDTFRRQVRPTMAGIEPIYLDIETDRQGNLTVLGFNHESTGLVQLVAPDIDLAHLREVFPREGIVVTFNGTSFDLPRIKKAIGVNLRRGYGHRDLRYLCERSGLTGGQKKIEAAIGHRRKLPGMDGKDALRLWMEHQAGEFEALDVLLAYNAEDIEGLRVIDHHCFVQVTRRRQ